MGLSAAFRTHRGARYRYITRIRWCGPEQRSVEVPYSRVLWDLTTRHQTFETITLRSVFKRRSFLADSGNKVLIVLPPFGRCLSKAGCGV